MGGGGVAAILQQVDAQGPRWSDQYLVVIPKDQKSNQKKVIYENLSMIIYDNLGESMRLYDNLWQSMII